MKIVEDFHLECPTCEQRVWGVRFQGQIRDGSFGKETNSTVSVIQCMSCGTCRLKEFIVETKDYESDTYRIMYNDTAVADELVEMHDFEQVNRLEIIGIEHVRNEIVMDFGCGHGAFLDVIKGVASRTIGVETFRAIWPSLMSRGHEVCESVTTIPRSVAGMVGIATSFGVIEHLEDPVQHLVEMWSVIRPGGRMVLQTDNLDDFLLVTEAKGFAEFFYRSAHNWYFTPDNIRQLSDRAGMQNVVVNSIHQYNFANFMRWHRDGIPTGFSGPDSLGRIFEATWKASLEANGVGNLIMLVAVKNES